MLYQVYLAECLGAIRNHQAIFVETHEDGDRSGFIYQVSGTVQLGMNHEFKQAKSIEESASFLGSHYLGTVSSHDYPRIKPVCAQVPPPAKQYDGPRKINPALPLRTCQEWCQEAIAALEKGVLKKA